MWIQPDGYIDYLDAIKNVRTGEQQIFGTHSGLLQVESFHLHYWVRRYCSLRVSRLYILC